MIEGEGWRLHHGDCRAVLAEWADQSVDSIVCDPPYELGFMGKKWDSTGIAYQIKLWAECLRVLKPGGYLLAFGGTRTYHRMACAIEDAGFEIRDSIHWLYGSGFPKSLDVSKAIDKSVGAEREVVGERPGLVRGIGGRYNWNTDSTAVGRTVVQDTAPATDAAKRWAGYGTALKPAYEPVVVARRPLVGTVASNVLEFGTGAINIDGCRIGERWPANVVLSHQGDCDTECVLGCAVAELDQQSGPVGSWSGNPSRSDGTIARDSFWGFGERVSDGRKWETRGGGASRFFTTTEWDFIADVVPFRYVAKPAKRERNTGLKGLEERNKYKAGGVGGTRGLRSVDAAVNATPVANHHPTVKPVALMRWLVRLVTPPDGVVVDPFAGSGTTLVAAILERRNVVGIELTDDYLPIIEGRCRWAESQVEHTLFDGVS